MKCENKKFGSVWIHCACVWYHIPQSAHENGMGQRNSIEMHGYESSERNGIARNHEFSHKIEEKKEKNLTFTKMDMYSISKRDPYETDKKWAQKNKIKPKSHCDFGILVASTFFVEHSGWDDSISHGWIRIQRKRNHKMHGISLLLLLHMFSLNLSSVHLLHGH